MPKLWFKAKRYGWGWYPCSIEGWFALVAYVAFFVVGELKFISSIESRFSWTTVIVFSAYIFAITAGLIYISYRKGEKPGWHWGGK